MAKRMGQQLANAAVEPSVDLRIDRTLDLPMYLQICQRFKTAIEQGHLRAGDRVPAIRALAAELNLARGTVELAYSILADEGYFQVRGAAGTVVSPSLPPMAPPASSAAIAQRAPTTIFEQDGDAPKPLQMGLPALDAFPRKVWNRLLGHRLRAMEASRLVSPSPIGYEPLRERIAAYLAVSRGITCLPEQVIITNGLRNSLELIISSLASSGDEFWFEDPGYIFARLFLHNTAVKVVPVPVDHHGLVVDAGRRLSPRAKFAMVTPSHQSPLGMTLSLERRMALLEWACHADSWVIEDDYDIEFRYQGRPLPAMKSLDRNDRVIYCGTFSKAIFPGLRLAYMVVPVIAVPRFQTVAYQLSTGAPYLFQAGVADFMAEGHFSRHMKKMRALYTERRILTQQAFQQVLGNRVKIELQSGGLHLLLQLAASEDDVLLADIARSVGMAMLPLSRWYIDAPPQKGLLLGFANVIDKNVASRLANEFRQALP